MVTYVLITSIKSWKGPVVRQSGYRVLSPLSYLKITFDFLLNKLQKFAQTWQEAHGPHRSPEKYFRSFLGKGRGHSIVQTWILCTQGFFVPRLVEIFNFVNVFSLFRYNLPSEKGRASHLNELECPSLKYALYQIWIGQVVLERIMKMWKLYRQSEGDRRSYGRTTGDQKSLLELSAQVR